MKETNIKYKQKMLCGNIYKKLYYFYRYSEVPFTGIKKPYRYFRNPKTLQEKKLNCKYKNYIRKKRNYIPNAWDDIDKQIWKNWKYYRYKQYKKNYATPKYLILNDDQDISQE